MYISVMQQGNSYSAQLHSLWLAVGVEPTLGKCFLRSAVLAAVRPIAIEA